MDLLHTAILYMIEYPPSTVHVVPVIYAARGLQRNVTTQAISSARANLPIGILGTIDAFNARVFSGVNKVVSTNPGSTQLIRIPRLGFEI